MIFPNLGTKFAVWQFLGDKEEKYNFTKDFMTGTTTKENSFAQ